MGNKQFTMKTLHWTLDNEKTTLDAGQATLDN